MDFKSDLEEIKKDIANEVEQEETKSVVIKENNENLPQSFEDAKNQALANFKPTYDDSKPMYENAKDIAKTIGVSEALKDNEFLNEVKEGAKENIRTDMDTDQKKSEIENQQAFYTKHRPVLEFARQKEPCDLVLMKWIFAIAVIPYIASLIVSEIFNVIGRFFEAINDLFNSITGIPQYVLDEKGQPVKDNQGRFIVKGVKVNLLTKIIFWFAFVALSLIIIFAVIKGITGFDIINAIKNLING